MTDSDQPPPQNLQAEQCCLGAALLHGDAARWLVARASDAHWFQAAHRHIHAAIRAVVDADGDADLVTVAAELRRAGRLEECGSGQYLTALINEVPTAAHLPRYWQLVHEAYLLRSIQAATYAAYSGALRADATSDAILSQVRAQLDELWEQRHKREPEYATAEVVQQAIGGTQWLWPDWLPRGYLTLLAGDPGIGKSGVALWLCGAATGQLPWPDNSGWRDGGCVVWVDAEGAHGLTTDRIRAWGLDPRRVLMPGRDGLQHLRISEPADVERLRRIAEHATPELIVVDSLSAAHGGDENSSDIRHTMRAMAEVARDYKCGLVLIHHLTKRSVALDGPEVELRHIRGSTAIVANSRVVIAADHPDRQAEPHRLRVIKSNLSGLPEPLGFLPCEDAIPEWCDAPAVPREETPGDRAFEWLREQLHRGAQAKRALIESAREMGIIEGTLKRAAQRLRVEITYGSGREYWGLPAERGEAQ